ncbi:MAG: hypothetical protein WBE26_18925 [Phycisphaerae bacterium]
MDCSDSERVWHAFPGERALGQRTGVVRGAVIRRTQVPLLAVKKDGKGLEFLEALSAM